MKSKNSRMGSGVGAYVRVVSLIKPNKPLILLKKYSIYFIREVKKYLKKKLNINTYIIYKKLKL
jgi:ribosomal protein L16/L10AE